MFINDKNREATVLERFLSGSIAGGLAQSLIYPLEVWPFKIKYFIKLFILSYLKLVWFCVKPESIQAF